MARATYNVAAPTSMAEPSPTVYGVMGPAYAQSLQKNTGSNIFEQMTLRGEAGKERSAYEGMVGNAQNAYLKGLDAENRAKLEEALINTGAERADKGVGGAYGIGAGGTLQVNQPQLLTADASHLNATHNKGVADLGTGVKALSEAGYDVDPNIVGAATMAPGETDPLIDGKPRVMLQNPGMTLKGISQDEVAAKKKTADAAMVSANAAKVRADKGTGDTSITFTDSGLGLPPARVIKMKVPPGVDPNSIQPPGAGNAPPAPAPAPAGGAPQAYTAGQRIPINPKYGGGFGVVQAGGKTLKMPNGQIIPLG